MKDQIAILVAVSFVAFLVAYLLGIVIVRTVDNRLTDISINMPAITLPKNHISVKIDDNQAQVNENGPTNYTIFPHQKSVKVAQQRGGSVGAETGNTISAQDGSWVKPHDRKVEVEQIWPSKQEHTLPAEPNKIIVEPIDRDSNPTCISNEHQRTLPTRTHFVASQYKSEAHAVDKPETEIPTDTRNTEAYPASYPKDRQPVYSLPKKQLVPTYYRNPRDMNAVQILKFKTRAKFNKMTVEDYENWLMLYADHPEDLEKRHRDKLRVILKGGRLGVSDLPQGKSPDPPLNAEQRFHANYPGYITNLPTSDTAGPQYGYNFDDFDKYTPPANLKHMSRFNPDELKKEDNNDDIETRPIVTKHTQY